MANIVPGTTNALDAADIINSKTTTFNNVEAMQLAEGLEVGDNVRTLGYYAPGDGGGNDYEIVADATGTDDGGSFIDLAGSGTQAKGLFPSGLNVKQFGARADGITDSYTAIKNAVASGRRVITIPTGSYFVGTAQHEETPMDIYKTDGRSLFLVPSNTEVKIFGEIIIEETGSTNTPCVFSMYEVTNSKVSGGRFTVNQPISGRHLHTGVPVIAYRSTGCTINAVKSHNTRSGAELVLCSDCLIKNGENKTDAGGTKATVSFASYGGVGCGIIYCTSKYSTSDGNIGLFGGGDNNYISNCYLTAFDENGVFDGVYTGQGVFVDSNQKSSLVFNNTAKAFFYNIDVKTTVDNCQVIGNTVVFSKVGIAVRQGEGLEDVFGTSIIGNNIVMSNYPRQEVTTYYSNYPGSQKEFFGSGVLLESVRGTVNVSNNSFYMDRDVSENYTSEIIGVYCRANLSANRVETTMLNVTGNSFNFESNIGLTSYTNKAPVILAETNNGGYLELNFSSNNIKVADHGIPAAADRFGLIEISVAESARIRDNTSSRKVNFGAVCHASTVKKLLFSGNQFVEDCTLHVDAVNCDDVVLSDNQVFGGSGGSSIFRTADSRNVICNSNTLNGGTAAVLLNSSGASNVILTSNFAQTAGLGYDVGTAVSEIANNIFLT